MNKIIMRGEIWTIDLGVGVGSEQRGHKYCLVIQNDVGNQFSPTTIVVPITSKSKNFQLTHVELKNILSKTSYVLCEQIRVVDKSRLQNRITSVDNSIMDEVGDKIKMQLGM